MEWVKDVFDTAKKNGAEPFTRELILRPTDLPSGYYFDEDDPSDVYAVTEHDDQNKYLMLWFGTGEADQNTKPGDLVFKGVHVKGVSYGDTST